MNDTRNAVVPPDKFAELPDHVKKWLSGMSKRELDDLDETIRMFNHAKIIGRFGKYAFGFFLAMIIVGGQVVDGFTKVGIWISNITGLGR